MSKTVKGFKVGDIIVCSCFDINNIPDDGSFKGWATDHKVVEIIDDTTIKLQMVSNPEKEICFNFREDEPNQYYVNNNWYTGIFCDLPTMVNAYQKIYKDIQTVKTVTDNNNSNQNENQK